MLTFLSFFAGSFLIFPRWFCPEMMYPMRLEGRQSSVACYMVPLLTDKLLWSKAACMVPLLTDSTKPLWSIAGYMVPLSLAVGQERSVSQC